MTCPAVLALDLSLTATGVAMPDGTITTIRPLYLGDRRLIDLVDQIESCINRCIDLTLIAVEGPVTRSQAATAIGMVHGAVRLTLMRRDMPYLVVPPATLKTYATGRGNAPKPDMRMSLYKRTGRDITDDNQVDAAWLRYLALDLAGTPELQLPQTHRRALTKLTLPALLEATP